jgi:hypothetical protein
VLKNNSDIPAEAHVARSSDGKPYPLECCSWKVTYKNELFLKNNFFGNTIVNKFIAEII